MFWSNGDEAGRWAQKAIRHATVAVGNQEDEVELAVGAGDPYEASERCSSSESGSRS